MTASDWTPTRALLAGLFAAVVVGLFCAGLASWHVRTSPEQEFSGFFQGDMATYVCYARSAASSPTKLFYNNPHDIRPDPARRFVHLPMTLMGAMLELGVPATWLGMVLRGAFGWLMYFLLARVLSRIFPKGFYFWPALFLVGLGGGAAWVAALSNLPAGAPGAEFSWSSLAVAIRQEERAYYWWFLSTFRNLMYPLELIYHSVVFAYLYAAMKQRWRIATSFLGIAALTNP
ncbi:MAG: hypothetical protein JRH11_21060, partial [Deltaproteobacteria bacterium]|nr:hypothetical protein [Deltaproteobacteria bacterium]